MKLGSRFIRRRTRSARPGTGLRKWQPRARSRPARPRPATSAGSIFSSRPARPCRATTGFNSSPPCGLSRPAAPAPGWPLSQTETFHSPNEKTALYYAAFNSHHTYVWKKQKESRLGSKRPRTLRTPALAIFNEHRGRDRARARRRAGNVHAPPQPGAGSDRGTPVALAVHGLPQLLAQEPQKGRPIHLRRGAGI